MNDRIFLEKLKNNIFAIYDEKSVKPVDTEKLNIDFNSNLDNTLEKLLYRLSLTCQLLTDAHENRDEFAMKSALLGIRAQAISLLHFLNQCVMERTIPCLQDKRSTY